MLNYKSSNHYFGVYPVVDMNLTTGCSTVVVYAVWVSVAQDLEFIAQNEVSTI